MPRLLLFAPCERVIVNPDDNNVSLITLLTEMALSLPPGKIPSEAQVAYHWQILALWLREPGDEGRRFEQLYELLMPDGRSAFRSVESLHMSKRIHRQKLNVRGFPVSKMAGECLLRLSLREGTADGEWRQVAEYPILLAHSEQQ